MSPEFKYSQKQLNALDSSAPAASAPESSVLILGTLTGRVACLDLSGDKLRWYEDPKDKPSSQTQVTALRLTPNNSAFFVGFSDGHFQIRSAIDNSLLGLCSIRLLLWLRLLADCFAVCADNRFVGQSVNQ